MPRRVLAAGCALALVTIAAGGSTATADPVQDNKRKLDQQIATIKSQLEDSSAELVDAAVRLQTAQAGLTDVRARLAAATSALDQARRHDLEVASQLAYVQAQQAEAAQDHRSRRAQQATARLAVGQLARQLYIDGGVDTRALAVAAAGPADLADRLGLVTAVLGTQKSMIDRLATEQADLRARSAQLSALDAQVRDVKRRSAASVRRRATAEQTAAAVQRQQTALVAQQTQALAMINAKVGQEKARLNQMQSDAARLQAILAARARAGAPPGGGGGTSPSSGYLSYPAAGPVTSGFGMRFHPILRIWRLHSGTDFGIGCGTPVYAVAAGTVISAGWAGGYGNRVVIDHGWRGGKDLATTYSHLTSIVAGPGSVNRGQLIAYSGTTGLSTGCHLHFEVLINGGFVDPMRYL